MKQVYGETKKATNTCFPHPTTSSFWQGIQVPTASCDHKNQNGLNPHWYLTEMIVCDPANEINRRKYNSEFRK